jgi:hypothetical protein
MRCSRPIGRTGAPALAAGACREGRRREPPAGMMTADQLTAAAAAAWVPGEDLARHAFGPRDVRQTYNELVTR